MPSLRSDGLFRLAAAALRPRSKGALPPSALRLPPPRSPRGRGAGHTAFGLLSRTLAEAWGSLRGVKGTAAPSILTRSVLAPFGAALRVRLPVLPLTPLHLGAGHGRRCFWNGIRVKI